MTEANRLQALRIALVAIGATFVFAIYPLTMVWPSGWAWGHEQSHYLMMILGVYATLGVFLILAARDPEANRSLIWFTVWSSIVHSVIMAVQSFTDGVERGHLFGDVPALLIVTLVLAVLSPRRSLATA